MEKLQKLLEIEGFKDEQELAEAVMTDSVCPGICMNPDCNYTTEVEPDQAHGYCESCDTQTVKSAVMIMGLI